uniref:CLAVATA3/ESR (CLE)-related protein 9 n=1 Tax=Anthurium amnicola TaxID=1678845 RepID=A0A1D1XJI2_9ARAE
MASAHIPTAEPPLWTLALVAILLSAAAMSAQVSEASSQVEPSATLRRCHRQDRDPRPAPPSWCIHIARNPPRQPPPPPDAAEEIDPLYGDVKRLVPSGPNPLHN